MFRVGPGAATDSGDSGHVEALCLQMHSFHQLNALGDCVQYVCVCVCVGFVCVFVWVGRWVLSAPHCKALRDRWLLSLIASCSTGLLSLALGLHPVLAVASQ